MNELDKEIKSEINEHRKAKWLEHLANCPPGSQKLWKTIKGISQPTKQVVNTAIKFNNKLVSANGKIANLLNRQYTPSVTKRPSQQYRATLPKLKLKKTEDVIEFTPEQTKEAIRASKSSKAMGPDDLSPIMLKHLGSKGIKFLPGVYNCTVNTAVIPALW